MNSLPKAAVKEIFELQFHAKNKLFIPKYSYHFHIIECSHYKSTPLSVNAQQTWLSFTTMVPLSIHYKYDSIWLAICSQAVYGHLISPTRSSLTCLSGKQPQKGVRNYTTVPLSLAEMSISVQYADFATSSHFLP